MTTTATASSAARRVGVALVIGVLLAGLVFAAVSAFELKLPEFITGRPYQEVGPTVVESIQELSELTSVEMVEYTTIEKGEDHGIFNFLAGDRLFLFAVARIGAGVDLAKLSPESFVVDQETGTVVVQLPAPEVFYSYLDTEATEVVDRDTGLLTKGDVQLESDARREAEAILREQAVAEGILDEAQESAEQTIANFLHGLGYSHVVIERSVTP
ncbi:MAG: DUF4230 domain-containing protein [Actinobacteria bacterium]|nr:MAG: DUF4230 domain-containing protein [Actinomycetota bacterium]